VAVLSVAGIIVSSLIAHLIGLRRGGFGMAVLAFVAASAAGMVAMFVAAYLLSLSDPTRFPPADTNMRAIGNMWIVLLGSGLGLWTGRRR
jgi:hypothetical protein